MPTTRVEAVGSSVGNVVDALMTLLVRNDGSTHDHTSIIYHPVMYMQTDRKKTYILLIDI